MRPSRRDIEFSTDETFLYTKIRRGNRKVAENFSTRKFLQCVNCQVSWRIIQRRHLLQHITTAWLGTTAYLPWSMGVTRQVLQPEAKLSDWAVNVRTQLLSRVCGLSSTETGKMQSKISDFKLYLTLSKYVGAK